LTALRQVQSDPVSHRYVVHISDTGLLNAPTRARSATDLGSDGRVIPPSSPPVPGGLGLAADGGRGSPGGTRRGSSHQYRFDCELGDVWTELTTSTSLALATTHRGAARRSNAANSSGSGTAAASSSANTVSIAVIVSEQQYPNAGNSRVSNLHIERQRQFRALPVIAAGLGKTVVES